MNRRYPDQPVAAVGAVIVRRGPSGAEVVLVKRKGEPARGKWSIPGGAIELGEPAREAVKREIREECGLEISPLQVFEVFDSLVPDDAGRLQYHYVIIDFLAEAVGGEIRPASDVAEAKWVPVRAAHDMDLTRGTREILRRLELLERGDPGRVRTCSRSSSGTTS